MLRLAVVVSLLVLAGCSASGSENRHPVSNLRVEPLTVVTASGEHVFQVEIADTEESRNRGLMYRPPLGDSEGMLFQFPDMAIRSFWMANTPSSLDIIYIDDAGRVVSIARHTTPYSTSNIYSTGPAKGVLELRAGRSDEIGLRDGDRILHPFFGSQ